MQFHFRIKDSSTRHRVKVFFVTFVVQDFRG